MAQRNENQLARKRVDNIKNNNNHTFTLINYFDEISEMVWEFCRRRSTFFSSNFLVLFLLTQQKNVFFFLFFLHSNKIQYR